jgi:hypothetical protein
MRFWLVLIGCELAAVAALVLLIVVETWLDGRP